jgi:(4S)-4-hydroxy-5-phosphonooxypentane-2,3-dione isomerase
MHVVCVTAVVKPEFVKPFIEATIANASATRREPGNLRFDVLQDQTDPTRFVLYEVYKGKEDHASHRTTAHYNTWQTTVEPWMAQPRQRTLNTPVFYGDARV